MRRPHGGAQSGTGQPLLSRTCFSSRSLQASPAQPSGERARTLIPKATWARAALPASWTPSGKACPGFWPPEKGGFGCQGLPGSPERTRSFRAGHPRPLDPAAAGDGLQALGFNTTCPRPVSGPVFLQAQGTQWGCQLQSLALSLLLSPWPSQGTPALSSLRRPGPRRAGDGPSRWEEGPAIESQGAGPGAVHAAAACHLSPQVATVPSDI